GLEQAIDRRNNAGGAEVEALNFPILFASEYILPEVVRHSPSSASGWQELQQRGIVGTSTQQAQQIQNHIVQIQQARLRAQQWNDSSLTPELEAEASLENVEKMPGTCKRDVVYSKAALLFASRKKFDRALELAGKIEDLKQGESVKEAIIIQIIEVAIEDGDYESAQAKAEKISSPEHKARLYITLVRALAGKNDNRQIQPIVNEAINLSEKLSDPGDRAASLFSLSAILLKTDRLEAQTVLRSAVKHLNKKEPADQGSFEIPIKVSLSCPGEAVSWYGGSETLPNSSVLS